MDEINAGFQHTHISSTNVIHGIPFLCNPIRYPENRRCDLLIIIINNTK